MGNQGSFLEESNSILAQRFDVVMFSENADLIEGGNMLLPSYASELSAFLEGQENLEAIVFLGGEVRNENVMMRDNFHKPLLVANFAFENKLELLYLSSLSVYDGLAKTPAQVVTTETKEAASSVYGRSKLAFDNEVAVLREKGLKSFTLRPASIVGSWRMSSSVEQVARLAKRFPLLRYFRFDGIISYVTRSELSDLISDCLQGKLQDGIHFAANNISVSCVIWASVGKPLFVIPADRFLSFLDWSLSSLRSTALKNLTNRLVYQNDYAAESPEFREIMLADILDKVDRRLGGG